MARRKNTKFIDPRYFLNETTHRDNEDRIDEIFGFGKAAKARKRAQTIIDASKRTGEVGEIGGEYFSTPLKPWMGDGRISKRNHPAGSDELGRVAMYIGKRSQGLEDEILPEEEKAYQRIFRKEIEDRQASKDRRAKQVADSEAAAAADRDPKKFYAQLRQVSSDMMAGEREQSGLAKVLGLEMIKLAAEGMWGDFALDNLSKLIPALTKAENFMNRYESNKKRYESIKKDIEQKGVEINPNVISNIDNNIKYIEKRVMPELKAYWKKAYKNAELADKYNYASDKQIRDRESRVGVGSRSAPDMSDREASRGYPGLRRKMMREFQLKEIIKEELNIVLSEATRADYYECLEKVPQMYSANSREFGKCLDNPSAYKPPESKKRTLDDIPDIGVSRTGGPRPKDHPFNKYNPRDYDE